MSKSTFEKTNEELKRTFKKRTVYDIEQYYDMNVRKINDTITIDVISSQLTKIHITSDKEMIKLLIADLQEAIEL